MTKEVTTRHVIAVFTVLGMPPLINLATPRILKKNTTNQALFHTQSAITPLLLGAMWMGITFAIKRDIKLAYIVGGSIAGALYLFYACDLFARKMTTDKTFKDCLSGAAQDTSCLIGLGTGFVSTALGLATVVCIDKIKGADREIS